MSQARITITLMPKTLAWRGDGEVILTNVDKLMTKLSTRLYYCYISNSLAADLQSLQQLRLENVTHFNPVSTLSLLFTLFASYVLRIMQTIKQSLSATKLKGCHPISENKRNFIWNILEWQQETCWLVLNLSTPYLNKYLFTAVCIQRKIVRKAKQNQMIAVGVRRDEMKI